MKARSITDHFPLKKNYNRYFDPAGQQPIDLLLYKSIINLIQMVPSHLPGRPSCLLESIVLHLYFRTKGIYIPAYLGINKKDGFFAHKWNNENQSYDY